MADAYGMLVFSKSKDCKFDSKKLKGVLNRYEWNNDGFPWEYDSKSKRFYFNLNQLQYPTVIPFETISYEVDDGKGSLKTVLSHDMTAEDFDNVYDDKRAHVSLKRLCKEISKTLKSGWVELACTSNMKQRYVIFECMRVDSNGKATRQAFTSGLEGQLFEEVKLSKKELGKD